MKKFTRIKESQDAQKSYLTKVEFTIITRATSESEAAKNVQLIAENAKKASPYITEFKIASITEERVNFPDFSTNENTMAVKNTEKMMFDYLNNSGAQKTDQHYVNLEKILKVFQTGEKKSLAISESKEDVNVDQMTTDICDIKKEDLDDAIKAAEDLMKEFKDKDGDTNNQQYANMEELKKTLMSYKKDLKFNENKFIPIKLHDYSSDYSKEEVKNKLLFTTSYDLIQLESISETELRGMYNLLTESKNLSLFNKLNNK